MRKDIIISSNLIEKRIALLEDDELLEFIVEKDKRENYVNNVYKGRVQNVLPGMQAAFIDIGLSKAGYLHISDIGKFIYEDFLDKDEESIEQIHKRNRIEDILKVGDEVIVQVEKNPIGNKGAKLKTTVSLAGRFLVIIPDYKFIGVSKKITDREKRGHLKDLINKIAHKKYGFIVRTSAQEKSDKEITQELKILIERWEKIKVRASKTNAPELLFREMDAVSSVIRDFINHDIDSCIVDDKDEYIKIVTYLREHSSKEFIKKIKFFKEKVDIFTYYQIVKDIEKLYSRKVWMKSGAYLIIDHTEAMTVIDVNTGRFVGKKNTEETFFKINMESAEEICRQLRLRDMGGIIMVDFIDMRDNAHKKQLLDKVRTMLRNDRTTTKAFPLTELSLMQITRKKIRQDVDQVYSSTCPVCHGAGSIDSINTVFSNLYNDLKNLSYQKFDVIEAVVSPKMADKFLLEKKSEIYEKLGIEIKVVANPLFFENQYIIKDEKQNILIKKFVK